MRKESSGEVRLSTTGPLATAAIEIGASSALRVLPAAADHLSVAAASPRIVLNADGQILAYGLVQARGTGSDVEVRADGRVLLDGLLQAVDEFIVDSQLSGGTGIELSQLLLKSDAQGRLLDSQNRLINSDGFLIDASGQYVDASGNLLPDGAAPVLGGAPVRLSGGTLNASAVSITSASDLLLAGQIGELSASGNRLVSGTGSVSASSSGVLDLRGRVQGEGMLDLRADGTLQLRESAVILGGQRTHLLGDSVTAAGYAADGTLLIVNSRHAVDVTGLLQSGGNLRVHAGVPVGWADSQLLSSGILSASLTADQNISVRESGVLDATGTIHAAAGGSFTLAASAVVSPNLTSISEPILVQRERVVDVVVGTRQVNAGTQLVSQVNYVPTQVTEQSGTQTIRIGSVYRTMDVNLIQVGYSNGTQHRSYFVEKSDYQNVSRSWSTAPVIPWSSYRVFADGTVQNVDQSPASDGQTIPVPEADLTFTQLTDDQRSVVLDHLGYKRLFAFSFSNGRAYQTINGNTSVIPWTPEWQGAAPEVVNVRTPGLTDKYIELPKGAIEDFLRVAFQGSVPIVTEAGRYRDRADIRMTQTHSALQDQPPLVDDYDDRGIGFSLAAISDSGNPYGVRNGFREYELFDTQQSARQVSHPGRPIWYGGSLQDGFVEGSTPVTAPAGLLAEMAEFKNKTQIQSRSVIAGTRRIPNVCAYDPQAVAASGGIAATGSGINKQSFTGSLSGRVGPDLLAQYTQRNGAAPFGAARDFMLYGVRSERSFYDPPGWDALAAQAVPGVLTRMGYNPQDLVRIDSRIELFLDINPIPGTLVVGVGRNYYYADALINERETFRDSDVEWVGNWHSIQDSRSILGFEWTTPTEDVFGTVPRFTTVTKNVPVIQQVPQTVYRAEPIVEQQTVLVTERIEQTLDGLPSATFANESLRAGQAVTVDVGKDAGFIGLTRATSATAEIVVRAGRDVTLDGEVPDGAAAGTKAAVADLQAGLRVDVQGGRNVLMRKDAILKADDGNADTQTGVIRLKAGQTLTVESDAFGGHEVFLHSDGDVLMQSKMTSGHLIDVKAGLGASGIGSVITSIETDLETLGSEINLAAGINGGDLQLTNAAILTAGPITLSAPAGSLIHSGGQIIADSLSAVVKNGLTANLDVRTVSASITGTGDLNLTTFGNVTLASVTLASGSVDVAGFGNITAQNVQTLGGSGDITLSTAAGNVALGQISAAGSFEAATQTGQISGLTGGSIFAAEGTNFAGPVASALPLTSNDITLITRQSGDVILNYTGSGPLTLRQVHVLDGSLIVNAPGDLIVLDARLLSNTGNHTVQLTAGGDVVISHLEAGDYAETPERAAAIRLARGMAADAPLTALNNVSILAGGAIREAGNGDAGPDLIANRLTLQAGGSISDLELAVNELPRARSITGSISLTDLDSVGELSDGIQAIELAAPAGGIQLTAGGGIRGQRVNAGGTAAAVLLDAGSSPLFLSKPVDSSLVVSSAGDLALVGSDITWTGTNTASGAVTVTATGSLQVDAADFSLTAGSIAWQSTGLQTVKGTLAATSSVSLVSTAGDLFMSAAVTGRSGGTLSELTFRSGGDMNLSAGSFGSVQNRLTIAAGKEFPQSVTAASLQVTGPNGELSLSAGGNLTFGRYDVIRAAQSVTLASTGYVNSAGVEVGGNLTVLAQPLGVGTAAPRRLQLEAANYLHLHEQLTASEQFAVRGGRTTISEYTLLMNRGPQLLADGANAASLLNALVNSVISLAAPRLELLGGTQLEIDQQDGSGDQLTAASSIVLSSGSVALKVSPATVRQSLIPLTLPPVTPATVLTGVLTGTGGLNKRGSGTLELSAANTYTGATRVEEGVLVVSGSTAAASSVTVAGGRLQGTGNIQGPVTVTSAGVLAPGNSPGVLQTGSLTLASGGVLQIDIAGTTAGSGYDQLNVTGTVDVTGGVLSLNYGSFTANAGSEYLILQNDGTDAIVGRFQGLADGDLVTDNFAGSGRNARISYYAGTGNDIALIVDEPQPQVTVPNNGQPSDVQLRVVEETIQVVIDGQVKRTVATDGINGLTLAGNTGVNDTMRLNFTGDNVVLLSAVDLIDVNLGGDASDDLIVLVSGIDVTVTFNTAQNGIITVETLSIPFTGLGQNTLTVDGAQDLTLTLSSDATNLVFTADATPGFTQVTGTNVATTQFVNPTGSLILNLGTTSTATFTSMDPGFNPSGGIQVNGGTGDNSITFTSLGSGFSGPVTVTGNGGTDSVVFNGTLQAGSLNVQSESIQLNGASLTTTGGAITFNGPVSLGTAASTLNSSGGNISFQSTVSGSQNLVLAAGIGSGTTTFTGAVSNLGTVAGPALTVQNGVTGLVYFQSSLSGNSGLQATGSGSNLRFDGDVTLGDGGSGTNLAGNVRLDGLTWSGYDGLSFGTVTLSGG
ncbi:MAG: beta strand repeat-containing protein, partial [Planctomycetaceae bacterium]